MNPDSTFRRKFLEVGCFYLGILACLSVVVRYIAAPFPLVLAVANIFAGVCLISIRPLSKRGSPIGALSALFLFCLSLFGINSAVLNGGLHAPSSVILSMMPLAACFLGGRRHAHFGLAFSIGTILLCFAIGEFGWISLKEPEMELPRATSHITNAIGLYFIGISFEAARAFSELKLSEREAEVKTIINSSPIGMVALSAESKVLFFNDESRAIFSNIMVNQPLSLVQGTLPTDTAQEVLDYFQFERDSEHAAAGRLIKIGLQDQTKWVRFRVSNYLSNAAETKSYLMTMTDETDSVAAQEMRNSLVASSKMAALGEMAGGVAHEINNPLSIIVGKCDSILNRLKDNKLDPNKLPDDLTRIASTAKRIAKITSGLLAFSRSGGQSEPLPARIVDVVEETVSFCADRFKHAGISLTINFHGNENTTILCQPQQITQILLNLLNNALDQTSTPSETRHPQPEPWVRIDVKIFDQMVHFFVTDGGFGIPESVREKIFNPFFTTKPVGSGTGLGLSISKGLAESQRGTLAYRLDPEKHLHTCFQLSLPLVLAQPGFRS